MLYAKSLGRLARLIALGAALCGCGADADMGAESLDESQQRLQFVGSLPAQRIAPAPDPATPPPDHCQIPDEEDALLAALAVAALLAFDRVDANVYQCVPATIPGLNVASTRTIPCATLEPTDEALRYARRVHPDELDAFLRLLDAANAKRDTAAALVTGFEQALALGCGQRTCPPGPWQVDMDIADPNECGQRAVKMQASGGPRPFADYLEQFDALYGGRDGNLWLSAEGGGAIYATIVTYLDTTCHRFDPWNWCYHTLYDAAYFCHFVPSPFVASTVYRWRECCMYGLSDGKGGTIWYAHDIAYDSGAGLFSCLP